MGGGNEGVCHGGRWSLAHAIARSRDFAKHVKGSRAHQKLLLVLNHALRDQQFPEFLFRYMFEHKCSDGSHLYVRRACGSQRWVIAWSAKPEWEAVAFLNWETHLWFDKGLQELATTMHVERREWSPHRQAWLAAVASTVAKRSA